jgi:hypothetical protein
MCRGIACSILFNKNLPQSTKVATRKAADKSEQGLTGPSRSLRIEIRIKSLKFYEMALPLRMQPAGIGGDHASVIRRARGICLSYDRPSHFD